MRRPFSLFVALMLAASAWPGFAQTNFVVSDYNTFAQALSATTNITNFQANAQIVVSNNSHTIATPNGLIIDGGQNNVTFSGSGVARIFHVRPKTTNTLVNLVIKNGTATQGGAIFNEGTLTISNCAFAANTAANASGANGVNGGHDDNGTDGGTGLGTVGGAIFSKGPLTILYSAFTNNSTKAGNGGNGGNGTTSFIFGGNGGNGGDGGGASGGAIYATGSSNYIFATLFEANTCLCGAGGLGGLAGSAPLPGHGGRGGTGGSGDGGALFCNGLLRMSGCFFQENGITGGATALAQGAGNDETRNGNAGGSAEGGAIFLFSSASGSTVTNCTMLDNFCSGGLGGGIASGTSGDAGGGGAALGGAIASIAGSAQIQYCTIATNLVAGGSSGASNLPAGLTAGSQIYSSPGSIKLVGSIVSGGSRGSSINTFGVRDGGFNLSSDSSGISQDTSLANRNPLLSVGIGTITTNLTISTNGGVITSVVYPTTNFIPPVITNFFAVSNTLAYPSNLVVFNLTTNFTIPLEYNYDLVTSYTYTNLGSSTETNTTFTTNFVAGSNGGPTPTLSLSNGSPALNFVTGIPGISFPLKDQRLFFRVSPTALGAFDPNGISELIVTNGATNNNFSFWVTNFFTMPPSLPFEIPDVTSFTINGTNLIYIVDAETNSTNLFYSGTNITFVTNSVASPGTNIVEIATNIPVPVISGPMALGLGQGATLRASVSTNVPGLGFQWQLNGSNLIDNANFSGTTTSNLVLKNINTHMQSNYTVVAGTTLTYVQTSAVFQVFVTDLPKLSFTVPTPGARTAAQPLIVRGTVTLASTVTNIQLWITNVNDGSVQNVSIPFSSSRAIATWSATVHPNPGTNLLTAWTFNTSGYQSPTVMRKFFSVGVGQLTLSTQGSGFIGGATDKSKLNIGQSYSLVAHPGARWLFANWSVLTNGGLEIAQDGSPTLRFLMEANTTVIATFITNMFLPAPNVYNGLFYALDTNTGPAGIITGLTVGGSGAYSAKVFAWGFHTNVSIAGIFSPTNGFSSNSISASNVITLAMTNFGDTIFGTATDTNGVSQLHLNKMIHTNFNAAYTLLFIPDETNAAQGYGYALMTNRNNTTVISGALADGTSFSQSVGVGADGEVAFFAPLYTNGGVVFGWIPPQGDVVSNLVWIKPAILSNLFSAGFSNHLSTASALWKTTPPISLADGGAITFSNGGLTAPLTLDFTFGKGNRLSNTNNGNFGVINPNNGLFTVTITNGSADGILSAKGVVMKNLTNGLVGGAGFFLTSSNSGAMILTPNP